MMKLRRFCRKKQKIKMLLCWIFLMALQIPQVGSAVPDSQDEVLLEEAFYKIGQKFEVFFNYDRSIASDITVEYNEDRYTSLEEALSFVLRNTNLKYRLFDQKYVVIYQNDEEGLKSLRKMIEHFQDIVDEGELVKSRRSKVLAPLGTFSAQEVYNKRLVVNISGTVTDQVGEPLIGVNVLVKGTNKGASTDFNGNFTLEDVDENAVLVISYIGYQTQEISLDGKQIIAIKLRENISELEELVVVGYGSVKKSNITTSISNIKAEAIENRPITSISEAFAGQLAGVRAMNASGKPGQDLKVVIRGTNSVTSGVEPLYIIDGVPTTTLQDINPQDIESIEVLKDASAAAIYGARGAGGIVIVTSKSGKIGAPTLSFNSYYSIQQRENVIDVMNKDEYIEWSTWARNEAWVRSGGNIDDPNSVRSSVTVIPSSWSNPETVPNVDWQDEIYRLAPMQNYQLSLSGGTDKATYLLSGNYVNQEGIVINSDYEVFSFRSNTNFKITPKVSVGLNLTPSFSTYTGGLVDGKESLPHKATFMWPTLGTDIGTEKLGYTEGMISFLVNPIALSEETIDRVNRNRIRSSIFLNAEVLKNLQFRTSFGYDRREHRNTYFQTSNVRLGSLPIGNESSTTNAYYIFENTLSYKNQFNNNHNLNALVGTSIEGENYSYLRGEATGYPNDLIYTMNVAATPTTATSSRSEHRIASVFGRVLYDFNEKYLFSSALRYDGSSRFGAETRFGLFPSLSGAWILSKESFMRDIGVISFLKLRASWGKAGNNFIGNYSAIGSMSGSSYSFNGNVIGGFRPGSIDNPILGWESTETSNVGIDLALYNNRVQLSLDGYLNNTNDMLLNVPVPTATGFGSNITNIGQVQNRGWEMEVFGRIIEKVNFKWESTFNLSNNVNEVKQLGETNEPIIVSRWGAPTNITEVGEPMGAFYLYESDGLLYSLDDPHLPNQEVGNTKIIDQNNDGIIDNSDRKILGKANPDFIFGLQNSFKFKNFDLRFLLQGQWGADLFFFMARGIDFGEPHKNQRKRWLNGYRSAEEPGDGTVPLPFGMGDNAWFNDSWLYNAAFLRIKNINMGYSLPKSLLTTLGIDKFRIYIASDNVFTFDSYPGVNVEGNSDGNLTTYPGHDYGTHPLTRKYMVGINLTF
ncbi:SusC/RagA family TonB-linked outer membrane protein [Membranihabitans maritimus]|uniref:SusC/RagA family TonB-linked outer membrane protein n=1 Tax=Membranihabitans maritimus TaxID=2904244 RepID=UPI001F468766|nr:TonB-dependent receptor [Membranihabitans maritimus]